MSRGPTPMTHSTFHPRRQFLKVAAGTGLAGLSGWSAAQSFAFQPNQPVRK